MSEQSVRQALDELGLEGRFIHQENVTGLEDAAVQRGVEPRDVVKTIVVRRGEQDYVLVLVPGDRAISWPLLRRHLGVQRLSLPDKDAARVATGYERGTITPFAALGSWPVVADSSMAGRTVTLGGGARDVAVAVDADAVVTALRADVADVTRPATDR